MRNKTRALPVQYKLTEQEKIDYERYIAEYISEYKDLSASDLRQLEMAALDHILGLRLIAESLEQNRHILNTRYSYQQMERALLSDLGLTRSARLKEKPANSDAENDRVLKNPLSKLTRKGRGLKTF